MEELLCSMHEERRRRPREQGSGGGEAADPLLSLAVRVLLHSLSAFSRSHSASALRLAHRLAEAFSLPALLAAASPPLSPSSLLSSQLLPLLPSFLSPAALSTASAERSLASPFLSLVCDALQAAGDESPLQADVLRTVLSSAPAARAAETAGWLRFVRLLLPRVRQSALQLTGAAELDDFALSAAESLLSCSSAPVCDEFAALFPPLLPLLSPAAAQAVLSSFLDALSGFVSLSGRFAPAAVSPAELKEETGADMAALPALLLVLSPFLSQASAAGASAPALPPSPPSRPAVHRLLPALLCGRAAVVAGV